MESEEKVAMAMDRIWGLIEPGATGSEAVRKIAEWAVALHSEGYKGGLVDGYALAVLDVMDAE